MTDEEEELMKNIYVATREAHNEGVSKIRISGLLSFMASGAIDPKSLDAEDKQVSQDVSTLEERLNGDDVEKQDVCPVCKDEGTYTEIEDVVSQLGGQLIVMPCRHTIEWEEREELKGWVEQYEPVTESSS